MSDTTAAPGAEAVPTASVAAASPPVDPIVRLVVLSDAALDADVHEKAVDHPRAGARVVFCGVVREHDHGREVTQLEYQGHPSAQRVLAEIAESFANEPDVLAIAVSHRTGHLAIGDVALVAAVATAHRRAAFETCARLVEEIKARLPIWKRQVFTDGTDEWVNCA